MRSSCHLICRLVLLSAVFTISIGSIGSYCDDPGKPTNGYRIGDDFSVGQSVHFGCNDLYELIGMDTITCETRGMRSRSRHVTWSDDTPVCVVSHESTGRCGPSPKAGRNAVKLSISTKAVLVFGCKNDDYTPDKGDGVVQCIDKRWTGRPLECRRKARCHEESTTAPYTHSVMTGLLEGDTVSFSCSSGYVLPETSSSVVTCTENGQWSAPWPSCQAVNCGDPPTVSNAVLHYQSTSYQSIVSYTCPTGYHQIGHNTITCQATGKWSQVTVRCEIVTCPNLVRPSNGRLYYRSAQYNSTATYQCITGYVIIGSANRTCREDGKWHPSSPYCEPVSCGTPPHPMNGFVNSPRTTYRSVATYRCNRGYQLIGEKTRLCSANGSWSSNIPTCSAGDCGSLSNPANGVVTVNLTTFNSIAKYRCINNTVLVGQETRVCQADSNWSGISPSCVPGASVNCGSLSPPSHGTVNFNSTQYNSVAVYTCENGYRRRGVRTRQCQRDRQWSDVPPTCERIQCRPLSDPLNGFVDVSQRVTGSLAVYDCNEGYTLIGESVLSCNANGLWSGTEPTCQIIDCLAPPVLLNGSVTFTNTTFGSIATYHCIEGLAVVGSSQRECQANGSWSGDQQTSCVVDCGLIPPDNRSHITYVSNTLVGALAKYYCFPGYFILGSGRRTCQANGTWTELEHSCQPVNCGPLPQPKNGEVLFSGTTLAHPARYRCNIGFELIGMELRVCTINGQWSGHTPTCEVINCGIPPSPLNGHVEFTSTNFTSLARYSCQSGYILQGPSSRVCNIEGNWTNSTPTCNAIDCGNPEDITRGTVDVTTTTFNSRATYSCDYGYRIEGAESTHCQSNGTWDPPPPVCIFIDCGDPGQPERGYRNFLSTFLNANVTYSCPNGLQLYGNASRTCQRNGWWSGSVPTCGPITCGEPAQLVNGHRSYGGTTVGQTVTYSCNDGFELQGNSTGHCRSDGKWTGGIPTCRDLRPRCPDPGTPNNGLRNVSKFTIGSVVNYACRRGYRIVDPENRRRECRRNSTWSGQLPRCQRITSCSDPGIPNKGRRISHSPFSIGSTVYYICNDGYDLSGSSVRQCQDNGEWTGTLAACTPRNLSCSGAGIEFDSSGRRCSCVNRQLVNCCRYRQDWLDLSDQQRDRYIQAVLRVSSDPLYQPLYRSLMQRYRNSSRTLAQNLEPPISQFLPWHRYYLQLYEDMLRMVDPNVYIPYWDWTLLPRNPYQNPIFSPDSGFGNSSNSTTNCVNDGPFRASRFSLSSIIRGGCLKRRYSSTTPLLTRPQLEDTILTQTSFARFFGFLTLPYLTVRCSVGGTMCDLRTDTPSEDPLHILILSFFDSIWFRWQSNSPQYTTARYGNDRSVLLLSGGQIVSQYHDARRLPYDVAVCYGPPVDSVVSREKRQGHVSVSCPLQEWMTELRLSQAERDFVKAACRMFHHAQTR